MQYNNRKIIFFKLFRFRLNLRFYIIKILYIKLKPASLMRLTIIIFNRIYLNVFKALLAAAYFFKRFTTLLKLKKLLINIYRTLINNKKNRACKIL